MTKNSCGEQPTQPDTQALHTSAFVPLCNRLPLFQSDFETQHQAATMTDLYYSLRNICPPLLPQVLYPNDVDEHHSDASAQAYSSNSIEGGSQRYDPSFGVSPFHVEYDINIEFRKVLENADLNDTTMVDIDVQNSMQQDQNDLSWDHEENMADVMVTDTPLSQHHISNISSPSSRSTTTNSPIFSTGSNCSPNTNYTPATTADSSSSASPTLHPCSACDAVFRHRGQLNTHWNRKHDKRFHCVLPACSKSFNLKADLTRHIKNVHERVVPEALFVCGFRSCGKTYKRRDNMQRHEREHYGIIRGSRS